MQATASTPAVEPTTAAAGSRARPPFWAVLLAITIVGFVLASLRLGSKSLWLDEAVSADHARLGLHGLWKVVSGEDPNMGLYYVLLHFWVRLFGYGEAAVRSMTVVIAGLSVPIIALLGRRLFGATCGLAAGLLLALNPFFLQYEQTARSYAIVVLLVLLSSYLFVAAMQRPSRWTLVGYVLASSLAFYAHYLAAFVVMAQLLTLVAVRRRGALAREWLLSVGAIALLCLPELVFAHRAGTSGISWIHYPTLHDIVHFPSQIAGEPALAALLAILTIVAIARPPASGRSWREWFLLAWLLVPVLLDLLVSELGHPLFVTYYLIVVLPAFVLLAALGVERLPGRAAGTCALVLLVGCSAVGVRNWYRRPSQEDYRSASRQILAEAQPGDGLIGYPAKTVVYGLAYYEALAHTAGPAHVAFSLRAGPASLPARVWLVLRDSDASPAERRAVQRRLSQEYRQVGTAQEYANLAVLLYRRRPAPL